VQSSASVLKEDGEAMNLDFFIKYPVVFSTGLLVTVLVTMLWRRLAPKFGFMDCPDERKIHQDPIPVAGGIAVCIGFHAACALLFLYPWNPFAGQISINWWFRLIPLSVGVVSLGLMDDRFGMKPVVKLAGQTALALSAYALNIRIQNVLGLPMPEWINLAGTVLWFLAIMNAFNLIDGIDGLAAGIALIASIGIAVSLVFRNSPGDVLLFLGFAGACLGFLRYNYYPASVFLGDTGSLFIGFVLAALSISTSSKGTAIAAIGMPLLAVGVPLFDAILAVWRRAVRRLLNQTGTNGAPVQIGQADADHLHHRLLWKGRSHEQVAWLLYIATALLTLVGILTTLFHDRALGVLGLAFVASAYVIFRHLAWVEMRDTGELIMQGLSRPVRRNLSLLFYVLVDIIILNGAWICTIILMGLSHGVTEMHLKASWLRSVPVDVAIPFIMLMVFRAYSRVWSLAGIREYATVGLATLLGGAVACCVTLLTLAPHVPPWGTLLRYILMMGLAIPSIIGVRAIFHLVQGGIHLPRVVKGRARSSAGRALVLGEGRDVALFLRHWASAPKRSLNIIGIISSDTAIRGHTISGLPVFGDQQALPLLIQNKDVQVLYLLGDVDAEKERALREILSESPVELLRWHVVEEEIDLA
jgi:UDP-N-acetylmuramyl pentapeptide phosphotransferase/UDP-N-acetylglucosamine-1-phosphate transferase